MTNYTETLFIPTGRKLIAAWRGQHDIVEQGALFMAFDDGYVVAQSGSRVDVVVRPEEINNAIAKDRAARGGAS